MNLACATRTIKSKIVSEIDIEDAADEQLPGFGAGSALAGIGGLGYLLKRRFDNASH